MTQFRDRGDEIRVFPLSFAEFYEAYDEDKRGAWQEYYTYGGMPVVATLNTHEDEVLEILLDILASCIGSLTNPNKLSNTFKSEKEVNVAPETIDHYVDYFLDAFLIQKAMRYDVKGRKYIKTPAKYYYSDPGLRNARLGFRQLEETHLMENVLYNDLVRRGLDVDVGVVEYNTRGMDGKSIRKQLEVDFVVNRGSKKIVVVKDYLKPWTDEHGIQYIGIEQFLLDEGIMKM